MVDTTPKKQMVAQVIGGPFTFLGQYEDEGIIVIVRRPEDIESSVEEGSHVPKNPHELQPPLHNAEVKGDILLLRVAATEENEEEESGENASGDENGNGGKAAAVAACEDTEIASVAGKVISNEEFFLNYTKEEYVKFASRTDIVPQEEPEEAQEDDDDGEVFESDEEEENGDAECNGESDSDEMEDDEECQIGMMNLILAQILKRFREENGRGPNTVELLAMRSALAEKLGIDESVVNQSEGGVEETNDSKRKADDSESVSQREKRVKFTNKDEVKIMTDDEGAANDVTAE